MSTITFFEHQFLAYADMPAFPKDVRRQEQVLEEIERLNRSAGRDILTPGRKGLRAHAQVGVLRVGQIGFEILPKIDDPGQLDRPSAHTAARNLIWMLSIAGDIQVQEKDIAGMAEQPGSWFELLTRQFAAGLYREVISGLPHLYVSQQNTLPVLRGRWEIHRQFARLRHARPEFDVVTDDFTADNPLNQILRWVVERLFEITLDKDNRLLLKELREWFGQVTLLNWISPELVDQVHFTRLTDRFQPAFNMARLFLSASSVQPTAGELAGYAFTFDMNILFERFVTALMKRHRAQILPVQWHKAAVLAQAESLPIYLAQSAGQPIMRMRPDLLFKIPGQSIPVLIADTKYKSLQTAKRGLGIAEEDVYQMLAYSTRLNCPLLLLIYPQTAATGKVRQVIDLITPPARLIICTVNLRTRLSNQAVVIEEFREIIHQAAGLP